MHSYLILIVSMGVLVNVSSSCLTQTGANGRCINIRKCQPVLKHTKSRLPLKFDNQLWNVYCGFEGSDPMICCKESLIKLPEPQKNTKSPETVSNDSHPKLKLLDHKMCGPIAADPKIYGGSSTRIFEFPWMALLAYDDNDNNFQFNFRYLNFVGVRVGEHDLTKEQDCEIYDNGAVHICAEKYQDFEIEKIYPHPEYSSITLRNDIALVRIRGRINFKSANVRPICLPLDTASRTMGKTALITGWGSTEDGYSISNILLQVQLPILSSTVCRRTYRDQPFVKLWHKQICAGGVKAKDSCTGDSGGPLQSVSIYKGEARVVQQGVVSFGRKNCAVKGSPGVYTSVAHYVDWILDTIE
ncbi:PREDICTED: serine protease easter-like isoform X2 [Ceratosolen solmsi marchali]|uniref:CLIP domain-containing serine protease n=1 Tax=Ceratosolen solmsi marchali TaxID=326594 RepID=A0AAJ6YP97_9HYME|nr:PREDICTED: serine protease easter-like isoform X2 [Ceratosolen solmsi marchali]